MKYINTIIDVAASEYIKYKVELKDHIQDDYRRT